VNKQAMLDEAPQTRLKFRDVSGEIPFSPFSAMQSACRTQDLKLHFIEYEYLA